MAKIFVKCKDKTSSRWLPAQNISVVGSIPTAVEKTGEVGKLIVAGVLVEVSADEFKRHIDSQKKTPKADKLNNTIQLLEAALGKNDVKEAETQLAEAKKLGLKADDAKKIEGRIDVCKKKAAEAEALAVRQKEAPTMVEEAIEKEIIKANNKGILLLGKKEIAQDAEKAVEWAILKQENFDELKEALAKVEDK